MERRKEERKPVSKPAAGASTTIIFIILFSGIGVRRHKSNAPPKWHVGTYRFPLPFVQFASAQDIVDPKLTTMPRRGWRLIVRILAYALNPLCVAIEEQNLRAAAVAIRGDDSGLGKVLFGFVGQGC